MIKRLLIICCFIASEKAFGQQIPLTPLVQSRYNDLTLMADTTVFTGFRSINWLEMKPYLNIGSDITDSIFSINARNKSGYFFKNLSTDNWIQIPGEKGVMTIDPYVDATFGWQNRDTANTIAQYVGGLRLQGVYNDKLSFSIGFLAGYSQFPAYIQNYIDSNQQYLPSVGKGYRQGNGNYSLSQITGNITYLAGKHIVISAGYGKNFIGDGYRSLILSDNASNAPYIRLQAKYWKLTYNVIYNKYRNPRYIIDGNIQEKYSVMHYLGINFSSKFQMGLYDNVIWFAKDTGLHRGFDVQYLNPLIFMRPLEFAIGSPDNAFIGLTLKYKIYKKGFLYGQLGLDDLNLTASLDRHQQHYGNKYALQLGIYNEDLFNVKNLSYRFEWNGVRPYTYGHGFDKTGLNYTQNNQTLADPFNANFHEFISLLQYHNKRWYGMLQNIFTIRGENPGLPYNNGEDLWGGEDGVPPFGSKTLQGIKNKYFYNQLSVGYLINPKNGLSLQADFIYRRRDSPKITNSTAFVNFGIKTNLYNFYHDY
ncbi:MAG: hypothetical protein JSS67_04500 [Bacteroidetes bacterium]|nr:hypothetical protein [Bacteroidota bacterium]